MNSNLFNLMKCCWHKLIDILSLVQVEFPHGSLDQDLDAYLRVLYTQEPMLNCGEEVAHIHGALASPIIMLGPHGHTFSTRRKPVRLQTLMKLKKILFKYDTRC